MTTSRRPPKVRRLYTISAGPLYWAYSVGTAILGVVLMAAPQSWFGPTWSYFSQLPHNGFGMGLCCFGLGGLQIVALRRNASAKTLSILFFLSGFVYWTAGIILGAEGLLGHKGLMEVPFIIAVAGQSLALSAALMAHYRNEKRK